MKGTLRYKAEADRWVADLENEEYELHCGDVVTFCIKGQLLVGRIEKDSDWYVIIEGVKFLLHCRSTYSVKM